MTTQDIRFAALAKCRTDEPFSGQTRPTWFQTFPAYGRYPVGGIVEGAPPDS